MATSSTGIALLPLSPLFRSLSLASGLFHLRLCGGFCSDIWSDAYTVVFWGSEVVLGEEVGFEAAVVTTVSAARQCLFGAERGKRCLHGRVRCSEA